MLLRAVPAAATAYVTVGALGGTGANVKDSTGGSTAPWAAVVTPEWWGAPIFVTKATPPKGMWQFTWALSGNMLTLRLFAMLLIGGQVACHLHY